VDFRSKILSRDTVIGVPNALLPSCLPCIYFGLLMACNYNSNSSEHRQIIYYKKKKISYVSVLITEEKEFQFVLQCTIS